MYNPFEPDKNKKKPFESGSNNRYYSSNNELKSSYDNSQNTNSTMSNQNKSEFERKFSIFVIIIGCLIYSGNFIYNYFFYVDSEIKELSKIEIVDNYKYDFSDFDSSLEVNPFPATIPAGKDYTFDHENERAVSVDGEKIINMIVGVDVDPGIYSIKADENTSLSINSAVDTNLAFKQNTDNFNVPLIAGDEIDITFSTPESSLPGKVYFTAQSEYVNFEPGINGVFVYGLNQFDSEVIFEDESYDEILYGYNDTEKTERYQTEFIYRKTITLPGSPGSYFAVEYDEDDE